MTDHTELPALFASLVPYDGDLIDPVSTPYEAGLADATAGRVDLISLDFEEPEIRDGYRRGLADGLRIVADTSVGYPPATITAMRQRLALVTAPAGEESGRGWAGAYLDPTEVADPEIVEAVRMFCPGDFATELAHINQREERHR